MWRGLGVRMLGLSTIVAASVFANTQVPQCVLLAGLTEDAAGAVDGRERRRDHNGPGGNARQIPLHKRFPDVFGGGEGSLVCRGHHAQILHRY